MPLKKRRLNRPEAHRDARLIVIACEDTHAVEQYFRRFRAQKVQFRFLVTEEGRSSPEDVLARLDKFKSEVATEEDDELWVCIDTDHWVKGSHLKNLTRVLQQCRQKNYRVAISNPCFELWLLLHFCDCATEYKGCSEVEQRLSRAAGGYCKCRCDRLKIQVQQVEDALRRARALDRDEKDVIPMYPVTRVYRLVELLREHGWFDLR
ncbi:MAG: RloB family protein [Pirellulaceae bacterium]